MFSVVSRFSILVFLIGLRGFLPGFYSPLTISRSVELTFKKKGNYNNVTFGTENFQSGNHVTITII